MTRSIECQSCGNDIPVGATAAGNQVECEQCRTMNLVPSPVPISRATRIMVFLIDAVWYISLALFAAVMLAAILLGNRGLSETTFDSGIPIPIRVELEEPMRISIENSMAYVTGYNYPLVDHLLPDNLAVWFSFALFWGCFILWIVYQVRRLVRSVRRGSPFSPRNPRRIRSISLTIFAYVVAVNLSNLWLYHVYSDQIVIGGMEIDSPVISYHPELIILALILLIIAQVFEWGSRLQADFDRTV
ncbi:MAG: DUF2975 domain-containing protein [Candidatus Zixiibacteriota bacterium]|nr:MAG: DUF2975 domain-containing protein [candidate division Zixibacteria bacterium]